MAYADFDKSNYPLVIITFTGEKATKDNFLTYLAETTKLYEARENIGILFDATNATFPGIAYQKMQARWLKEHESLMNKYCIGVAYNIPNQIIKTALDLIFKLQRQPVPFKVFSSNEQSLAWLQNNFKNHEQSF